jgi:hypothetical protein
MTWEIYCSSHSSPQPDCNSCRDAAEGKRLRTELERVTRERDFQSTLKEREHTRAELMQQQLEHVTRGRDAYEASLKIRCNELEEMRFQRDRYRAALEEITAIEDWRNDKAASIAREALAGKDAP